MLQDASTGVSLRFSRHQELRACACAEKMASQSRDHGAVPEFVNLDVELEELAKPRLGKMAYDYYTAGKGRRTEQSERWAWHAAGVPWRCTPGAARARAGAETGFTARENRAAFGRLKLMPRMMRDVSTVSLAHTVLGKLRAEEPLAIITRCGPPRTRRKLVPARETPP